MADQIDDKKTTIDQAVDKFEQIVSDAVSTAESKNSVGQVGYYIGGWNPHDHKAQCYRLFFEADGKSSEKTDIPIGSRFQRLIANLYFGFVGSISGISVVFFST